MASAPPSSNPALVEVEERYAEPCDLLDAAVVTRVMGRRLFTSMGETWATERPAREGERDVQRPGDWLMYRGRAFGFFEPGFTPSTSVEHAWRVVERMRQLGYALRARAEVGGACAASFARPGEAGAWVESRRGMPHAISVAALAALGRVGGGA